MSPMKLKKIVYWFQTKFISLGVVSKQASKMAKEGEVGAGSGLCDLWIAFLFVLGSPSFILNGKSDYLYSTRKIQTKYCFILVPMQNLFKISI